MVDEGDNRKQLQLQQQQQQQAQKKKRKRFVELFGSTESSSFTISFLFRVYYICVSMCKYECVRRASKKLNFREVGDDDDWTIFWTDTSVGIDRVAQMKKWQV